MQSDVQTAQSHLPPANMPGLQANYSAGLAAYAISPTEIQQGLKDLSDGSDSAAEAHFSNAGSATNEGTAKIQAATADIQAATG